MKARSRDTIYNLLAGRLQMKSKRKRSVSESRVIPGGYIRVRVGGSLLVDSDEVFGDFLMILCSSDVTCR